MKSSMKSFHSIPYSQVCKIALVLFGLIASNCLYIFSDFSQEPMKTGRIWDTAAYYIGIAATFTVLYCILYLKEKKEEFCVIWMGMTVMYCFLFVFECYASAFRVNINAPFIYLALTYISTIAIVSSVWLMKIHEGVKEATKLKLLSVCRPLLAALFLVAFIFMYAPFEFPDVAPMREWDRALFYMAEALQLVSGFLLFATEEATPLYKHIWGSLLLFCTVYTLRLIKLIIWGTNGWTKMFCAGLFYVTLGYIIFRAIYPPESNDKPKLT